MGGEKFTAGATGSGRTNRTESRSDLWMEEWRIRGRGRPHRGDPDRKTDPDKAAREWIVLARGRGRQTAVKGSSNGRKWPPHLAGKGREKESRGEQWRVYGERYKASRIGKTTKRHYTHKMIYQYGIE